jgi:hypothetical protein
MLSQARYYALDVSTLMPRVYVGVQIRIGKLLDLRARPVADGLGYSRDDLMTLDWRAENRQNREALTQAIGRIAFQAGWHGLVVPSAADPRGSNVVAFPDRFDESDWMEILGSSELPPRRRP